MTSRPVASTVLTCVLLTQLGCETPAVTCDSGNCGEAVVLTGAPVRTLFPPIIADITDQALADLIYWPLAEIGFDLNTTDPETFSPRLARSWTFEDSLTLVFQMDPDARWHDGAPVTANDVAFTYAIYTDPRVHAIPADYLESVDSVVPRDGNTAVFHFNRTHREQFYTATYHMRILPRHLLDSIPPDSLPGHELIARPVGNGPYKFVRLNEGVSVEIEADTTFFLGRPGIPRMEWRFASDPNSRLTLLVSEEADILPLIPGPENVALAKRTEHIQVLRYAGNYYGFMAFNLVDPNDPSRPHPVLSDPVVRRAIALAVDRDQVARTTLGDSAEAPVYPTTPVVRVHTEEGYELPFDPDAAMALLDSANYRDTNGDGTRDRNGIELELAILLPTSSTPRRTAAPVIQSFLDNIGIEVTVQGVEPPTFYDRRDGGAFDAYLATWFLQPSPVGIPGIWGSPGIGNQNYGAYSNPRVDSLFSAALLETDPERELELWEEAFAEMNRDPGAIWIYQPVNFAAIHRRFENVTLRPDRWATTMWQWKVRESELLARDIN